MSGLRALAAGNWKMNGDKGSLAELEAIVAGAKSAGCDVAICPPATLIGSAVAVAAGSKVRIGGQDCHKDKSGAHTGDIAAEMIADAGGTLVIVGHSERRTDHGETDALVCAKAVAGLAAGLTPIICVGETKSERDSGAAEAVVERQLVASVPDAAAGPDVVIAYEPVWAIGTGVTPTNADIAGMHAHIRKLLGARFLGPGRSIPILYGGSLKPANARAILALDNVDGGLVGGASLLADDFFAIISSV
jgi:triosephosphate isomerase (TIM)